jgi:5-methylcytosine-specific restriction endonuclease McrA
MKEYWRHFRWDSASEWCKERQHGHCANCGEKKVLQVHHIIPMNGGKRFFSAFNIPWNLVALCRACHLEIHAAMRPAKKEAVPAPPARLPMFPEL